MPVPTMFEITSAVALKKPSWRSRPGATAREVCVCGGGMRPRTHCMLRRCGGAPPRAMVWELTIHALRQRNLRVLREQNEGMARGSAAALIPAQFDWEKLHDAAAGCQACDLYKRGTQTVFGE